MSDARSKKIRLVGFQLVAGLVICLLSVALCQPSAYAQNNELLTRPAAPRSSGAVLPSEAIMNIAKIKAMWSGNQLGEFPGRMVLDLSTAENGKREILESDLSFALRLLAVWIEHPLFSFSAAMESDLHSQMITWEQENLKVFGDITARLRQFVEIGENSLRSGSSDNNNYATLQSGQISAFPADEELRRVHNQLGNYYRDYHVLLEADSDLRRARSDYCERNRKSVFQFCGGMLGGDWLEAQANVPIPSDIIALLNRRYFTPLEEGDDEALIAKITNIIIDDTIMRDAIMQARIEVELAQNSFEANQRSEKRVNEQMRDAMRYHANIVDPLLQKVALLQSNLERAINAAMVSTGPRADVEQSTSYQDIEAQVTRNKKRIAVIEERLGQLADALGESDFTRKRRAILKREQDNLTQRNIQFAAELAEIRGSGSQELKLPNTPDVRQAKYDLDIEGADAKRRIAFEDDRLGGTAQLLENARDELRKAEERYSKAIENVDRLNRIGSQKLVTVKHRPSFEAAKSDKRLRLAILNEIIAQTRDALVVADYAREDARERMLDASQTLTFASEDLVSGIYKSTLSQTAIEAGLQIKDALNAAKGGPGTFGIWATFLIADNVYFSPPKIYEPDYKLKVSETVPSEIISGYHFDDAEKAKETAVKFGKFQVRNFLTGLVSDLEKQRFLKDTITNTLNSSWDGEIGNLVGPNKFLDGKYKEQKELLESTKKAFDDKIFRNGKWDFGKQLGSDLLKGQLKSLSTEALKRGLAEFFKGAAWRNFSSRQAEFAFTVQYFRVAGNIYWKNRDTLAGLIKVRTELAKIYVDDESGFEFKTNTDFDVDRWQNYVLEFAKTDGTGGTEGNPFPGRIQVFLNDAELQRNPNSNKFVLGSNNAKLLRRAHNPYMTLKIIFQ